MMFMTIDSNDQIPRPILVILTEEVGILMMPMPEKSVGFLPWGSACLTSLAPLKTT